MLEAQNEGFANNLNDGDLSAWAEEGVLMLNTALTIPCKQGATSCKIAGHLTLWKPFSKQLITEVEKQNSAVAFILWGGKAVALAPKVVNPLHRVFKGGHPSPLSNPTNFFCKSYFTCSNKWLTDHAVSAVNWNIQGGMTLPQACIWTKGMTPKCTATCTPAVCN
jgi:uracil-DNA glycosylase